MIARVVGSLDPVQTRLLRYCSAGDVGSVACLTPAGPNDCLVPTTLLLIVYHNPKICQGLFIVTVFEKEKCPGGMGTQHPGQAASHQEPSTFSLPQYKNYSIASVNNKFGIMKRLWKRKEKR